MLIRQDVLERHLEILKISIQPDKIVHLYTVNDIFFAEGSNSSMHLSCTVQVFQGEKLNVFADVDVLHSLVKDSSDENIEIRQEGDKLFFGSAKLKAHLPTGFELKPPKPSGETFGLTLDSTQFREVLKNMLPFSHNPIDSLSSFEFEIKDVMYIRTNSSMAFTEYAYELDQKDPEYAKFYLHNKHIKYLIKALNGIDEQEIDMFVGKSYVTFVIGELEMSFRTLNISFPDITLLLNLDLCYSVSFVKDDLLEILKQMINVCAPVILLDFLEDKVVVKSETGTAISEMLAEHDVPAGTTIAMSPDKFLEAVKLQPLEAVLEIDCQLQVSKIVNENHSIWIAQSKR